MYSSVTYTVILQDMVFLTHVTIYVCKQLMNTLLHECACCTVVSMHSAMSALQSRRRIQHVACVVVPCNLHRTMVQLHETTVLCEYQKGAALLVKLQNQCNRYDCLLHDEEFCT